LVVPWIIDSQENLLSFLLSFVPAFLLPMSGRSSMAMLSFGKEEKNERKGKERL
jgi:hypothetical protein